MASAKQIAWRKKFAKLYGKKKKGKKVAYTSLIGTRMLKKSNPKKKNSSRAKLEQRLKQLEQEVEYLKTAGFTNYNPTTMQSFGESKKEIKEISDELKREMKYR